MPFFNGIDIYNGKILQEGKELVVVSNYMVANKPILYKDVGRK